MQTIKRTLNWFGFCVLTAATTVFAQKEQWLQYHTSAEGRAYRMLELTTNPPPNVALPKFKAQPYFARWTTPLDPSGGRWLCFDRARRSGPYDRVYVDSNGNGRLDDKPAASAARTDPYSAVFAPLRFVFKGEDGPITYHLSLRFMKYEANLVRLMASSAGYYEGQVDLGGKKRRIELVDGNVNGTFNDMSPEADECDRVAVQGDKVGERLLGRMVEVDGQFFRIEVARDGAFVKLQKAEDLQFGQVCVPETISEFIAFGENGYFVRKPAKGQFTLPVGQYHVHEWTINRKDDRGAAWQLLASVSDGPATFEVTVDKATTLEVGEPVRAIVQATDLTNLVAFDLRFQGRCNESIRITKGDLTPPGPRMTLVSRDGSYRSTNTFEFG